MEVKTSAAVPAIDNAVVGAVLTADSNAFAGKIQVFVACADVSAIGYNDDIVVNGGIDSGLNRLILAWN